MRWYTTPHTFSCGIDVQARPLSLWVLHQEGERLRHRTMPAGPALLLKAVAPSRAALVGGGEGVFPWDGLAARWARDGLAVVRGQALDMQAMHGGTAKNDTLAAQNSAVLRRGGLLPHASVDPATMRATRDLRRRRRHWMRQRAERFAHRHHPTGQDNRPELGKQLASNAHRDGGAERLPAPAGPQSLAGDLAPMGHYDQRRRDRALAILQTATPPETNPRSRLRPVPGLGELLRLVLPSAIQALARFPRVPEVVSSCRRVTCAQASAGQRDGPAGATRGNASLPWAFAAAAVLC
jgi:hypothetical protein